MLLCYNRLMGKIVEQPDILPQMRSVSWAPRFGHPLTEALTLFSMRTLLRSRQHRMIFSFYLGSFLTESGCTVQSGLSLCPCIPHETCGHNAIRGCKVRIGSSG